MSKITKNKRIKELERKVAGLTTMVSSLSTWSDYADDMLTELNHALPDPEYDAKCEAAVAGVEASLDKHRERLGLNKPKLKQLDQSVFDGLDEEWKFAAVDEDGGGVVYDGKPALGDHEWLMKGGLSFLRIKRGYDASNWQNSLIERKADLTGSDLCRAMLARGDKYVLCYASDISEKYGAENRGRINLMTHTEGNNICAKSARWKYAVPFNPRTGEPLTAKDAGL